MTRLLPLTLMTRLLPLTLKSTPKPMFKRQFGYIKTRYRDLAKNRAQLFTLFALGNPFLV